MSVLSRENKLHVKISITLSLLLLGIWQVFCYMGVRTCNESNIRSFTSKHFVFLGRARRNRDSLMESCTCHCSGQPPPPPPADPPYWLAWSGLASHCHVTVSRDHLIDGRGRSAFTLTKRTCWFLFVLKWEYSSRMFPCSCWTFSESVHWIQTRRRVHTFNILVTKMFCFVVFGFVGPTDK